MEGGQRQVRDFGELGAVYKTDREIAERVATAGALKNIKKPIVCANGSGITRRALDVNVQKSLREIKDPRVLASVQSKLEHIEQELLYSNYDAAVERIIDALRFLENTR